MSRVVFFSPSYDLAGAGYALKAAFDAAAPDWQARAISRRQTYLRYPTDVVWAPHGATSSTRRTVLEIAAQADVVHAMNSPKPLRWYPPRSDQQPVVHHLGTTFRRDPEGMSRECRRLGALEVTDSIDLLFDGIGWLPIPADLDALARIRTELYRPSSTIRIAHAPTDRFNKDTALVVRAVQSLARKYPIKFDLIERASNSTCLVRKAKADIVVDQLKYGFGLNAIECWAMGIPVVSGLTTSAEALYRARTMFGSLPWADADEATLEAVIEQLIVDEEWRAELGERGRIHAERWHSQASVVEMATAIYAQPAAVAA